MGDFDGGPISTKIGNFVYLFWKKKVYQSVATLKITPIHKRFLGPYKHHLQNFWPKSGAYKALMYVKLCFQFSGSYGTYWSVGVESGNGRWDRTALSGWIANIVEELSDRSKQNWRLDWSLHLGNIYQTGKSDKWTQDA